VQKLQIILIVYWAILTYVGYATFLSVSGSQSLPLSLAEGGDFVSLLRASLLFIILAGIGLVANHYLIWRPLKQNRK